MGASPLLFCIKVLIHIQVISGKSFKSAESSAQSINYCIHSIFFVHFFTEIKYTFILIGLNLEKEAMHSNLLLTTLK